MSRGNAGPCTREEDSDHGEGVAGFWRLFMAGRRTVREDRWESIWRTRPKGPEKQRHRRSAACTAERQRQSRVLVRLLYSEADRSQQRQSQNAVRAAEPRKEDD